MAEENRPTNGTERYQKRGVIGEGRMGIVYEAIDTLKKEMLAVKVIKQKKRKRDNRIRRATLNECEALQRFDHENIIELKDVYDDVVDGRCLVFELMQTDLWTLLRDQIAILSDANVKSYMLMLLKGLKYCHDNSIMHRDLKPHNLLIGHDGKLKLADFGEAKHFGDSEIISNCKVGHFWYRAPEQLLGDKRYSSKVDIWAAGCIFADLLLGRVFFQGENELNQLVTITEVLGTPVEDEWPSLRRIRQNFKFRLVPLRPKPLKSFFPKASSEAIDLLSKMFVYNPSHRISATDALNHEYFRVDPPPTLPVWLPTPYVESSPEIDGEERDSELSSTASMEGTEEILRNELEGFGGNESFQGF